MKAAMSRHFHEGKTSHYGAFVQDYLIGLATTAPARILNANLGGGLTVRQAHNGEIIVNVAGVGEIGWEMAVRDGHLRFG